MAQRGRKRTWVGGLGLAAALLALSPSGAGAGVILSTKLDAELGGLSFLNGDLVDYDGNTDTSTLFFAETGAFVGGANVDAAHILPNGNIILSTTSSETLGGLTFEDGDLVEYNPNTDTATLFLDEGLFTDDADLDAVFLRDDGQIILSTAGSEELGGLSFRDGDLVLYDPIADIATLFFDEDLFDSGADISAVHVLYGDLMLSVSNTAGATLGGLTFTIDDLVLYDPIADTASLFLDGDLFTAASANIDAVYVPEPSTALLLASGLGAMAAGRRRRLQ